MKTGRNDPCPCGSGKKFKKCCHGKTQATAPVSQIIPPARAATSAAAQHSRSGSHPLLARKKATASPHLSPLQLKWNATWKEFKAQQGEAREAVFLRTLDDDELMNDDAAFEMLSVLYEDAVAQGERERFGRMVKALAERRSEIYQKGAHYYLSWQLQDALVDDRPDVLSLTRALAAKAGRDIDVVNQGLVALAYHGQLVPLVEAMRVGWPLVKESDNVTGWGIGEFSEAGAAYEMYAYLEGTSSPDPADISLLERIRYFIEEPRLEYVADFLGDVSGNADGPWTVADFVLSAPKKPRRRDLWDDEDDEDEQAVEAPKDQGAKNLHRLICQFVGYLRRVEQVSYARGELIRHILLSYFIERNQGNLNPRPNMMEVALDPTKKLPSAPKPSHLLCPERVSFEVCMVQMIGFLSAHYHKAAALFEVVPAWLRFLKSKQLVDNEQCARTLAELQPLHVSLLKFMEDFKEDPTPYRSLKSWPNEP